MKTPSQIIREILKSPCNARAELKHALPLIEECEANSIDGLLEELGKRDGELILRTYPLDKEWAARYYPTRLEIEAVKSPTNGFGATPQEALFNLNEALNNK